MNVGGVERVGLERSRTPSWGDFGTHITLKFEFLTPGQVVGRNKTISNYSNNLFTLFRERSLAGQIV